MAKKNWFNLALIAIVIVFIAVLALRFFALEENSYEFSGPNIYRSVYVYEIMNEQGYQVDLVFSGNWIDTSEPVSGTARILAAEKGQYLVLFNNQQVTVGGPTSATEDIAADTLQLQPANTNVIKVGLEPIERSSLRSLVSDLDAVTASLAPLHSVGVVGDILIDADESLVPTLAQEVGNVLSPGNEITLFERGLRLSLTNADLSDLGLVNEVLNTQEITVTKVATSRLELAVRTTAAVSVDRDALVKIVEQHGYSVFSLKIIRTPVQ